MSEDIVAPTNSSKVPVAKCHDSGTCASSVHVGARGPDADLRVIRFAVPEGLHEGVLRRRPWPQRAAAHGVDLAAQRRAAVAPARAPEVDGEPGPGLLGGVEHLAAGQQPLHDALVVVAADDEQPTVVEQRGCAAGTAHEHVRAGDPLPVPRVEHLHGGQGLLLLVAPADGVELIRQRRIEVQERRDHAVVEGRRQGNVRAAWLAPLVVHLEQLQRQRGAGVDPVRPLRRRPGLSEAPVLRRQGRPAARLRRRRPLCHLGARQATAADDAVPGLPRVLRRRSIPAVEVQPPLHASEGAGLFLSGAVPGP
mmetsp:Transcript_88689/g.228743  ORF Transcript_88689/g.228743 Transcript_88689/m.228743 type:complete len:309 (-) Transcript_88689:18-944(-)